MSPKQELMAELSHQINSPLAVIRNALYLAGIKVEDPAVQAYLRIADESVTAVVDSLRQARARAEEQGDPPARPARVCRSAAA